MNNIVNFPTKCFTVNKLQNPSEVIAILTLKVLNNGYQKNKMYDPLTTYDAVREEFLNCQGGVLCVE